MNDECTCYIAHPCNFCVSLTEDEADVYNNVGLSALRAYRRDQADRNADGEVVK